METVNFFVDHSNDGWRATVLNVPFPNKNHDGWHARYNNFVVADGATPLSDSWVKDLKPWVDMTTKIMCEQGKFREVSLQEAWYETVNISNGIFQPSGVERTAAVSHVRFNGGKVESLTVGDVKLFFKMVDGSFDEVFDDRLDKIERHVAEQVYEGMSYDEANWEGRHTVNTPTGYYAFSDDPRIGTQAIEYTLPADTVQSIIIASDGFWRLFNSVSDMFDITSTDDAETIINTLNNGANKIVDDVTMLRLDKTFNIF